MTTALREINLVLDDATSAFVTEFISNIATVAGYRDDRLKVIHCVKLHLLRALAGGAAANTDAWGRVYRSVSDVVEGAVASVNPQALEYLREFLHENADLS